MSRARRDPVRIELLKNALTAIADEMAVTVVRTARSFVIKEALDFSTGLMDARGALIAQGLCLPLHMGSFPPTMRSILRDYGDDIRPGDVFATSCSDSPPRSGTRPTSAGGSRGATPATTPRSIRKG